MCYFEWAVSGRDGGVYGADALIYNADGEFSILDSTGNGITVSGGNLFENMGASSSLMTESGVANVQTSTSGIGNGSDTTDDTLFTYSLPINALSAAKKGTRTIATFHLATNTHNKAVKFWVGGTVVATTGTITLSNVSGTITVDVVDIDATHLSVTSTIVMTGQSPTVLHTPNLVVSDVTANATVYKITGASTTTGAASDVLGYLMKTWFEN
jgi:hypothetical protein